MSNVTPIGGVNTMDVDPDIMLENLKDKMKGKMKGFVLVGYEIDSDSEFFVSTYASGPEALWLLARAQKKLLDVVD